MEFTYNGLEIWGFGFHDPNHAAAAICAVLPFLWGWRRFAWIGWTLSAAFLCALALTYSRTGLLVAAIEVIVWAIVARRSAAALLFTCLGVAVVTGVVVSRFAPDAGVMNRLEIWWAGLKLAAANPSGVGFGNSGLLVSTFMLDGIEVRTLVNSHLTLLAEQGWVVGCAWAAFIAAALAGGWRRYPRRWIAFLGLTVSAFASSVFDWHVLFDFTSHGGRGALNFALSWLLFGAFLVMGKGLALERLYGGLFSSASGWSTLVKRLWMMASVLALLLLHQFIPVFDMVMVRDGFLVKYGSEMPLVLRDGSWPLKAVVRHLEDGYRIALAPGYVEVKSPPESVWLFGTVAETAHRFTGARITVVDPPEHCPLPPGVAVLGGISRDGLWYNTQAWKRLE